jgi:hypothetical protein
MGAEYSLFASLFLLKQKVFIIQKKNYTFIAMENKVVPVDTMKARGRFKKR